ncbi:ribose-5-phosphate isomerase [Nakamurella antarctica]|uniref:Ribose-5-phosphate isomerase B n=1 Tax=Nakamurella antarctica TaxID=1902245 RepID=A0A3G8ZMB6_9ACTN|nr:ribose-5-phosphate isomerase [Nakamurella antarctica]AZI58298.1 ribose-5-phosphate isomerase [Nakamurella antarctica]
MRIYLGSDHAGFELKAALVQHLTAAGHDVVDLGAHIYESLDDYPPFCLETGRSVVADPGSLGVVIGGSGNGEQIAANKVVGVRAILAWSTETAQLGRQHNDANVISIGARMHDEATAFSLVDTFIATDFSHDERHQRRIDLVSAYEADPKRLHV